MHTVETRPKRSPSGARVLKRDTYHSDDYRVIALRLHVPVLERRPSTDP